MQHFNLGSIQIKSMNQQKKVSQQDEHLDYIVSALHRKKKKNQQKNQHITYQKLYETMTNVVSDLDQSINHCKKYNQAKIHRKYQIILNDQRKRIQFLQEKIKQQHKARSPSKKYVQDLLDKLINFKFQNETLAKKNKQLLQQNNELKKKLQIYQSHVPQKQEKQQKKQTTEQIVQNQIGIQISGSSIQNQVISYLRIKNELRMHQSNQKTKFERYLRKIKDKLQNWSMRQFLQSIDKWSLEYLTDPSKLMDSQQFIKPKTQIMKPIGPNNSSFSYQSQNNNNSIVNRSLNTKIQIRTKKVYSYRNFISSRVVPDNILR